MTKRLILLFSLVLAFALVVMAADVTGKWTAQVPGRQGNAQERTFMFKVEGSTLTGSMAGGRGGDVAISEGKVSGDTISFKVTRERGGNTITEVYSGNVAGDQIMFKISREGRDPVEFTAKKAN
jgi:hypothetical protein